MFKFVLGLWLVVLPQAAISATPLELLDNFSGSDQIRKFGAEMYLNGFGAAITASQVVQTEDGGTALTCIPDNLKLMPNLSAELLRQFLDKKPEFAEVEVLDLILLLAIRDGFPCR